MYKETHAIGGTFDEERHWHIGFHLRDRSRKIISKISGKCQRWRGGIWWLWGWFDIFFGCSVH